MSTSSKRDFGMAMAMLFEAYATKPDDATAIRIRAYEDGLKDIPAPLLNAAVRRCIQTRSWFPKVAELRTDAERCRQELLIANPYAGCIDCETSKGWRPRHDADAIRMERCPCFARHQEKLAGLGVSKTALSLPPAQHELEHIER